MREDIHWIWQCACLVIILSDHWDNHKRCLFHRENLREDLGKQDLENRKKKMNRESKCGNSLEGPGSKEEERLESHEWLHQGVEGCFPPDSDTSSSDKGP